MIPYAHTATLADGSPDPNRAHWQRLEDHLLNVARFASRSHPQSYAT
jgi:hypothetical protein